MQLKKSLGQNFLRDRKILLKIIEAADLKAGDSIFEIGPGEGVLTEELLKKSKKVIATEIDQVLSEKLRKRFKSKKNLSIGLLLIF